MFCSKCGKEIHESEKFCHHCGTQIAGLYEAGEAGNYHGNKVVLKILQTFENRKMRLLSLITGINILMGMIGFIHLMVFRATEYKIESFSIFSIMHRFMKEIEKYGSSGLEVAIAIFLAAAICAAICLFFSAKYILNLLAGSGGRVLMRYTELSTKWGLGALGLIFMSVTIFNHKANEYYLGENQYGVKFIFWFLLVAAFLNLFLFIKNYLELENMELTASDK